MKIQQIVSLNIPEAKEGFGNKGEAGWESSSDPLFDSDFRSRSVFFPLVTFPLAIKLNFNL